MVESLKKLTVIWKGMNQFPGTQFAEVSCAQDTELCDKEGIEGVPAAVHYRNGLRLASWKVQGESPSPVWQFVGWVRNQLAEESETPEAAAPRGPSVVVMKEPAVPMSATTQFSILRPFDDMDTETALVGWCLVLILLGVVSWVVIEGFELCPQSKKEQANHVAAF